MGDNIWLADRDSSRTPMRWTPDRNSGFSSADSGKLFLPVVQSLVFNYLLVNVESQLAQSRSLLHWIRNVIHMRKDDSAFGLGEIEVVRSDYESVLSVVRSFAGDAGRGGDNGEDIRCVFSFSHHPVSTTITAPDLAGCRLFDLFGGGEFPAFDENGRVTLTIGTQSFYRLHIARPGDTPFSTDGTSEQGDVRGRP